MGINPSNRYSVLSELDTCTDTDVAQVIITKKLETCSYDAFTLQSALII